MRRDVEGAGRRRMKEEGRCTQMRHRQWGLQYCARVHVLFLLHCDREHLVLISCSDTGGQGVDDRLTSDVKNGRRGG
jgi:hypothetical protein